jgi:hypothetical protein
MTLFILSLLISNSSFPQQPSSDLKADGLKGKVKSIRSEASRFIKKSGNWIEDKPRPQKLISYDEEGRKVKEAIYNDTEDIFDTYTEAGTQVNYSHNKQGIRTESLVIYSRSHVQLFRRLYHYDQSGNRVEEIVQGRDDNFFGAISPVGTFKHEYDARGRRITTTHIGSGLSIRKWDYVNDEKGNPLEALYYREGKLLARESYEYEFDEQGNWKKKTISSWNKRNGAYEKREVIYRTIEYY